MEISATRFYSVDQKDTTMDAVESPINQVFVKLLDGKHQILNFDTPSISVSNLKGRLQTITSIPSHLQLLLFNNSRIIHDHQTLSLTQLSESPHFSNDKDVNQFCSADQPETALRCNGLQFGARKFPVVVNLLLRLRGGKGGFGSLLRGAATKAGQKKSDNNDACRDMNGRRLRHVNAEKRLKEWNEGAEDRKLEKLAEDYLKKKAKEVAKSGRVNGSDTSEKYVAKYREDSAKCMEEVEKSVRESLLSSKRKKYDFGTESDSKKPKIWFGKRKFEDSDDEDESDEDGELENEKSVIIDNGSRSDSGKEEGGSSGSVKLDTGSLGQGSSQSGSEDDDAVDGCSEDGKSSTPDSRADTEVARESDSEKMEEDVVGSVVEFGPAQQRVSTRAEVQEAFQGPDGPVAELEVGPIIVAGPVQEELVPVVQEADGVEFGAAQQGVSASAEVQEAFQGPEGPVAELEVDPIIVAGPVQEELVPEVQKADKPLNFNEYNSAEELQVLGIERLKVELQEQGLKCGGTVKERAARLYLLKTTPLDQIPKKLLAKK